MAEQFVDLFDRWAAVYDQSVAGNDVEYKDVLASYDQILQEITHRSHGAMIEFGVGTGNLPTQLVDKGHHVIGHKSSEKMLQELARRYNDDMIEFEAVTDNVTKQLVDKAHHVIGIEPSENMRIIAKKKLPEVTIVQGHFLDFPYMDRKVDTIASSYA